VSERDFTPPDPTFGPEVRPEVARECMQAWKDGRPWTRVRVLEGDPVGPDDRCEGSSGEFNTRCTGSVEAVQYMSAFAVPAFYCYEHALKQDEWDRILYDGPKPALEPLSASADESVAETVKRNRKKMREQEPEPEPQDEEIDL
jgi:hypothetical protein